MYSLAIWCKRKESLCEPEAKSGYSLWTSFFCFSFLSVENGYNSLLKEDCHDLVETANHCLYCIEQHKSIVSAGKAWKLFEDYHSCRNLSKSISLPSVPTSQKHHRFGKLEKRPPVAPFSKHCCQNPVMRQRTICTHCRASEVCVEDIKRVVEQTCSLFLKPDGCWRIASK